MADQRRKVLVTGARGRVAVRIVEQLTANGWSVEGFDRPGLPANPLAAEWVVGDVSERSEINSAMSTVDAVVHAVSLTGAHDYDFSERPFRINVAATYEVLEAARRHGVDRVVLLSEAPVHLPPLAGDDIGHWRSAGDRDHLYDLTKRLQEEICRDFADTFGMNIVALRLGHVVDGTVDRDLQGRSLAEVDYCRGGWICCHDVARAVVAVLEVELQGFIALPVVGSRPGRERFNVAAAERALRIQFREWFDRYSTPRP